MRLLNRLQTAATHRLTDTNGRIHRAKKKRTNARTRTVRDSRDSNEIT